MAQTHAALYQRFFYNNMMYNVTEKLTKEVPSNYVAMASSTQKSNCDETLINMRDYDGIPNDSTSNDNINTIDENDDDCMIFYELKPKSSIESRHYNRSKLAVNQNSKLNYKLKTSEQLNFLKKKYLHDQKPTFLLEKEFAEKCGLTVKEIHVSFSLF
jgi:hypothetical protein